MKSKVSRRKVIIEIRTEINGMENTYTHTHTQTHRHKEVSMKPKVGSLKRSMDLTNLKLDCP